MLTEDEAIYIIAISSTGLFIGYLVVNIILTIRDKIKHKKDDKKNK
jgi:hypothetical protein